MDKIKEVKIKFLDSELTLVDKTFENFEDEIRQELIKEIIKNIRKLKLDHDWFGASNKEEMNVGFAKKNAFNYALQDIINLLKEKL